MKKRSEIDFDDRDTLKEEFISYIDDVESEVNEALEFLASIKSVDDLTQVEECRDTLKSLSESLY